MIESTFLFYQYFKDRVMNTINFKEITLQDRATITQYLRQDDFMISDISFTNLYLWRNARRIEFCILFDCLVIQTTYSGEEPFVFFPIGAGDKLSCLKALQKHYASLNVPFCFHSLEKHSLEILEHVFGDRVEARLNRDRSDYVYLVQDLIHLAGRKFHKKKNHLNRFFETYSDFSFEMIDSKNALEVLGVWESWSADLSDTSRINESNGIKDVLRNYESLNLKGGILRVGGSGDSNRYSNGDSNRDSKGKIVAFSFGENLSHDICVIHIEKANTAYHGAYQAINQQLLKHCFSDIKYVNREEDLGIEGLRKAKLSYNPHLILEKFEAVVQG